MIKDIFKSETIADLAQRIESIKESDTPHWGVMTSAQMMAHLNVMFKMGYDEDVKKAPKFVQFMLRKLVKPKVAGSKPYGKNGKTDPSMKITSHPDFSEEKSNLLNNLSQVKQNGRSFFEGREHPGFGKMTSQEWNTTFYKHLIHHLNQFGA